jgi:DNA-binding transcriptional MocR family regulator
MTHARYKQLVDTLAAEIRAGSPPPGTRLPTHRQLADQEGVALVTATRVYAELAAMGLVSGEIGRGTFVKETALPRGLGIDQQAVAEGTVDLNFNNPSLPGQSELLRAALRQLAGAGDLEALLRYQPHAGRPHERATVARHLACRGLTVGADRVMIVNGAQHGLATTVMALLQPGDVVATDSLTYPGFKVLAEAHRLELAPIPAAGHGPDLDALERLCKKRRVRAVYAMPTLHNPLGWVMSASRRRQLVSIVRRHGLLIIEDAAYAFLAEEPPDPLAALAPETTVYVSGLSKSVATGLRVGFVAAPTELVPKLERAIRASTWNTPGVMTAIACGWLDDGTVTRLRRLPHRTAMRSPSRLLLRLAPAGRRSSCRPGCDGAHARADLCFNGRTFRNVRPGAARNPFGTWISRVGHSPGGAGEGQARDRCSGFLNFAANWRLWIDTAYLLDTASYGR